jgi:hypothetical protein
MTAAFRRIARTGREQSGRDAYGGTIQAAADRSGLARKGNRKWEADGYWIPSDLGGVVFQCLDASFTFLKKSSKDRNPDAEKWLEPKPEELRATSGRVRVPPSRHIIFHIPCIMMKTVRSTGGTGSRAIRRSRQDKERRALLRS